MQSLFKSKKKRDSHNKGAEDGSSVTSREGDQRSPSSTSAKSTESPLKSAQNALSNNTKGVQTHASGLMTNVTTPVNEAASTARNHVSALPQNVQQQVQQQGQNVQQQGSKILNSPFLGSNQQNQGPVGQGQPQQGPWSQQQGHQVQHGSLPPQPRSQQQQQPPQHQQPPLHLYSNPQSPQYLQNGHPETMQPQGGVQGNGQYAQGTSPQMLGSSGSGHSRGGSSGSGTVSNPGTPGTSRGGFRQQTNDGGFTSPLVQQSETPWAEYHIQRAAPSPRFGHSANYISARDGELFVMGGIRDMDILNDLWVIDTNSLTGYQLVTDGYKVGPRVGHASLVLGNAHVVFGGDTKIEETDPLDDNLYLLNTSSLKWTVAQPQGPRPCGRYGHSLSNVGARVYVFGGQVDEEFYDDMWAFDLTNWRSPNAKWERVQPITPPPPPRTNHTVVSYKDKLYLFGGANGDLWYSDTWCFDPAKRAWTQLECSGYVPAPCQGHAASIIDDVMYVFGGMSSQGVLIDQLFALKLTTLKWYTFQNLGPGPSPRSGHSLTAFGGDKILVWGGTDQGNSAYVLDVSRINYPDDGADTSTAGTSVLNSPEPNGRLHANGDPASQIADTNGNGDHHNDKNEIENSAGVGALGAGAAAATGLASTHAEGSQEGAHTVSTNEAKSGVSPEKPQGVSATKEVRELQPHVYAPQSSEKSGPTQARSNSAARNSMLFSKRRSVLLPTSPVKEGRPLGYEGSVSPTKGAAPETTGGFMGEGPGPAVHTRGPSNNFGDSEPPSQIPYTDTTRSPSRASNQVKSFVTEVDGEYPDERFVSAVDLHENQQNDKTMSRSHSRGLSLGLGSNSEKAPLSEEDEHNSSLGVNGAPGSTSSAPKPEEDAQFHKMEAQLGGMPGSMPGAFPKDSTAEGKNLIAGDDSVKSDLSSWQQQSNEDLGGDRESFNEAAESKVASTPGLRRSHPQTNLSLQNIDNEDHDTKDATSPVSQQTSHSEHTDLPREGAVEAGVIGLSDQMSSLHTDSPSQQPSQSQAPDAGAVSSDAAAAPKSAVANSAHSTDPAEHAGPAGMSRTLPQPLTGSAQSKSVAPEGMPDTLEKAKPLNVQGNEATRDFKPNGSAPLPQVTSGVGIENNVHGEPSTLSVRDELAQLRRELDNYRQRDLNSEHHQLKESHAQQLRELANLKDANGQLTRKHATIVSHNGDLKQRYDQLEKVLDGHVETLKAQQAALEDANAKIRKQQEELALLPTLKSENADLRMKLKTAESAQKHAEEQLAAVNSSYASLKSAHSDLSAKHLAATTGSSSSSKDLNAPATPQAELNDRVTHLVSIWDKFKLPAAGAAGGAAGTRGLGESGGESGGYKNLYETQKSTAEEAHRQVESLYREQNELKRQLRELSAAHSASPSAADVDYLKQQHHSAYSSLNDKHEASLKQLEQHRASIEDLRARLDKLQSEHNALLSEYNKAVSLSRNQQVALTKTREELNMSRAHAQRLEEQLEDASVQNSSLQMDHSNTEGGDVSHASIGSARNDQAALVIRDLRAQVVILEEEMQNQREQIMRLKKAALTH